MIVPPTQLDGASVIWIADGPLDGGFGFVKFVEEEDREGTIAHLAICQYQESPTVYVFACNREWKVIGDLAYLDVESAMREAERYYEISPINWKSVTG